MLGCLKANTFFLVYDDLQDLTRVEFDDLRSFIKLQCDQGYGGLQAIYLDLCQSMPGKATLILLSIKTRSSRCSGSLDPSSHHFIVGRGFGGAEL